MKTVKQVKDWLSMFPDDTEVGVEMDCFHAIVELEVADDKELVYRLELTEPKQ